MPYIQLQDVRQGMDRKRDQRVVGELGTAWTIKNGHISRGGDIQRRKKFVKQNGSFPSTTSGLYVINETLYTTGYDAAQAVNVPAGVTHLLTQHPTPTTAIERTLYAKGFDGKLYSIIEFADGNIYHFYDTTRVVDWDTLAASIGSNNALASALAKAIDKSPVVSATAAGPVITITSSILGTAFTITQNTINNGSNADQTITLVETVANSPGVAQVYTATIGGTFEPADQFTITINGTEIYTLTGGASGTGTSVLAFKKKLYSTASSNLYFSALNGPTQWIAGLDYGFINMASQTAGQETLTVAEEYQGLMAIFSQNNIRIWSISEDSSANVFIQTLQNTGTISPPSVVPYGSNDVFYLAASGIRSIKARDSSNSASVSDVGTPLDTHIRDYLATLTQEEAQNGIGMVEPIDGRFWMAIKNRIYVLSYFPSSKISGWSYYEVDFAIKNMAKRGDQIYVRGTDPTDGIDYLYVYGGIGNITYPEKDEDVCVIELPYLSANDPAGNKNLIGFDIVGINSWKVELLPDPSNDQVVLDLGIATGVTYGDPRIGVESLTPLFGLTLTCSEAGPATMSALAMHYSGTFEAG